MKKNILLLLSVLLMFVFIFYDSNSNSNRNIDTKAKGSSYKTKVIDSCEYVDGYRRLAHKGNCRFCEERDSIKWEKRKKELKEEILKEAQL